MKFRSEIPFGEGYRNIIDVMVHETCELGNPDIPANLSNILKEYNPSLASELENFADELYEYGYVEDFGESDWIELYEKVISELNNIYNADLKYCLWLADYDVVKNYYGGGKLSSDDIDAYKESNIILSDLGRDGILYAYSEMPEPIEYTLNEEEMEF